MKKLIVFASFLALFLTSCEKAGDDVLNYDPTNMIELAENLALKRDVGSAISRLESMGYVFDSDSYLYFRSQEAAQAYKTLPSPLTYADAKAVGPYLSMPSCMEDKANTWSYSMTVFEMVPSAELATARLEKYAKVMDQRYGMVSKIKASAYIKDNSNPQKDYASYSDMRAKLDLTKQKYAGYILQNAEWVFHIDVSLSKANAYKLSYTATNVKHPASFQVGARDFVIPYWYSEFNSNSQKDFSDANALQKDGYRLLTKDEWNYLLNTRPNASSLWARGTYNSKPGIFILPDGKLLSDQITVKGSASTYESNKLNDPYSLAVLFLPAAGYQNDGKSLGENAGYYWTSDTSTSDSPYLMHFDKDLNPQVEASPIYYPMTAKMSCAYFYDIP